MDISVPTEAVLCGHDVPSQDLPVKDVPVEDILSLRGRPQQGRPRWGHHVHTGPQGRPGADVPVEDIYIPIMFVSGIHITDWICPSLVPEI